MKTIINIKKNLWRWSKISKRILSKNKQKILAKSKKDYENIKLKHYYVFNNIDIFVCVYFH